MVGLGSLPGFCDSVAGAVSSDGKVVVGSCYLKPMSRSRPKRTCQAFRWTAKDGMTSLGCLPGLSNSVATAVSSDGKAVVGECFWGQTSQAFLWTTDNGMVSSNGLPDERINSFPIAVSTDGSLILRMGCEQKSDYSEAIGRRLQSVMINDYKLNLTGWRMYHADGISADGKTIVGCGRYNHDEQAWVAHLDRPVNEAGGKKAKGK
jgi:uncharacterized membrane protein